MHRSVALAAVCLLIGAPWLRSEEERRHPRNSLVRVVTVGTDRLAADPVALPLGCRPRVCRR